MSPSKQDGSPVKDGEIKIEDGGVASPPVKSLGEHRKGPTEDKNREFELVLKQRYTNPAPDFLDKNCEKLRAMSTGRPLKERLNIPDGVDVFQYGAQKLNIWEF